MKVNFQCFGATELRNSPPVFRYPEEFQYFCAWNSRTPQAPVIQNSAHLELKKSVPPLFLYFRTPELSHRNFCLLSVILEFQIIHEFWSSLGPSTGIREFWSCGVVQPVCNRQTIIEAKKWKVFCYVVLQLRKSKEKRRLSDADCAK